MLKALAASTTLKYAAACVCPVVGTAALTVSAPKVRATVHKLTEPPRTAKARPRAEKKTPARIDEAAGLDCLKPRVDLADASAARRP